MKKISIPFPKQLYGEDVSRTLVPANGYSSNILEIVAEMLLNASIVGEKGEHFQTRFRRLIDPESGERVVEDLCSGEWFRTTELEMKQIPGLKNNIVLLGLILSYDAASINLKTGNTATPLYVTLGNIAPGNIYRSSENVSFVGFFPKHSVNVIYNVLCVLRQRSLNSTRTVN